jgi:uncharacterized protein YjbJ (UPF0337 family)
MVNQQTLSGNWNDLKGRLRKKWGQLTNDDLQSFDGNVERLVGMIQTKTGETRNTVERYLEEITSSGAQGISQAADAVREFAVNTAGQAREYAGQAAEAIEDRSQQAVDAMRQGYQNVESTVRSRPGESVMVCFGAGVLTGLLLALTFRSR